MSDNTAPDQVVLVPGETRNCAVSLDDVLDTDETMTGVPAVAEQTSGDLTLTNKSISTAALTIRGLSVPIGRAVQFAVTGQLAGDNQPYTVKITAATDSTPAQTVIGFVILRVENE